MVLLAGIVLYLSLLTPYIRVKTISPVCKKKKNLITIITMCLLSYIIHLMAYVFIHSELHELYAYIYLVLPGI